MKPIPQALLDGLQSVPGFNREEFLLAHSEPAVTSVRLHVQKKLDVFPDAAAVPWCPEGRYLDQRPVFTLDPAYHAGAYYVQEASSMFLDYVIRSVLPERKGIRVLDLCAAPGGKTTLLASLLEEEALLISNEVIRTRASILEENVVRWGYANNWVTSNDPRDFGRLEGYFDVIVVDAPCSGSGLFRKDPRALDEWSEANVSLCSQRQQRILADVWPALKEDGLFIYATCSYSAEEDEQILSWMKSDLDAEGIGLQPPESWGITPVTAAGLTGYRFFPDKLRGEGFFIAACRKKEGMSQYVYPKTKPLHDTKLTAQAGFLLEQPGRFSIIAGKEHVFAIDARHIADYQVLGKALFLRRTGVSLGTPSQKEWIPDHELALSLERSATLRKVEVDREQALRFLKKEDMGIATPEKGWMIISYRGLGLGWIKSLGNRSNNYLPKHWRIRMELPTEWD